MVDFSKKMDALRKRVAPLTITDEELLEIGGLLKLHPRRIRYYYSEWIADVIDYEPAEYLPAQRDPRGHFARWAEARAKEPFRVSDLAFRKSDVVITSTSATAFSLLCGRRKSLGLKGSGLNTMHSKPRKPVCF